MAKPTFNLRLDCIDHYQAGWTFYDPQVPYEYRPVKVPVIRVFGSTETGQRVCAHFHGAFPYLYVGYPKESDPAEMETHIDHLRNSIESELASIRLPSSGGKYVVRITLVKGVPFYGYHEGYSCFLKIYLFNPSHITRVADLLREGVIMGTMFQPYESHLEYPLQFMCDYNLHGCSYIKCGGFKFRHPVPHYQEIGDTTAAKARHRWNDSTISPYMITHGGVLPKQSYCALEVDVLVQDILNRKEARCSSIHHDFVELRSPSLPKVRLVPSLAELWEYEERRRRRANPYIHPQSSPFSRDALVSMSAEPRSSQESFWLHEKEIRRRLDLTVVRERTSYNGRRNAVSFDDFIESDPLEQIATSVYDSVEDFCPEETEISQSRPTTSRNSGSGSGNKTAKDIGGGKAAGFSSEEFPMELDEEELTRELDAMSQEARETRYFPPYNKHSSGYNLPPDSSELPLIGAGNTEDLEEDDYDDLYDPPRPRRTGDAKRMGESLSPPPPSKRARVQNDGYPFPRLAVYRIPHYSDEKDVPKHPVEYGGKVFRLGNKALPLPSDDRLRHRKEDRTSRSWEPGMDPPNRDQVRIWNNSKAGATIGRLHPKLSQPSRIEFVLKDSQKASSVWRETQYMSVMSLEIHANTRGTLSPDPEKDEIRCVFWCLETNEEIGGIKHYTTGIVAMAKGTLAKAIAKEAGVPVDEEPTELGLIRRVVEIVRTRDPDILAGYDVQRASWGYLVERAASKYNCHLTEELSRIINRQPGRNSGYDKHAWGYSTHGQVSAVTGRHTLNILRLMQKELHLSRHSLESVTLHLLGKSVPSYSHKDLAIWCATQISRDVSKFVHYYTSRTRLNLEILERTETVARTSEQARILGIDFFSVLTRGSQFRVESMMFRLAKLEEYLLPSPSEAQVAGQNPLQCPPLVMEPVSNYYNSPVVVLDFQSLYPSIMIAYNYCYSTYLGDVSDLPGRTKMGFTNYKREGGLLEMFGTNRINVCPYGHMYLKPEVRKSLLGKMLTEILETRVMIKNGMETDKEDKILQSLLNSRQLALKLLANVTYGYVSATATGRMPCPEIADSIVASARGTLEKAISLIHSEKRWNAEVVYGDTDSIFVSLENRTRDDAFKIGEEIAKAVTSLNPRPVKLKLQKVYHPCILLSKKRYAGYRYERRDQKAPEFEAKGLETVRRDETPANKTIEEKALRILFDTADLSKVKSYFTEQCARIMKGEVSVQDFCFSKEVRIGTYKHTDRAAIPPAALIATEKMTEDPRMEPVHGERVSYVMVTAAPGAKVNERCVSPERLLRDR
ncbi:hypothetical protein GP486_006454 [Trichoglossum hirsutum]|uniref:DNA polymerase n=1 Tax=Trichoglossum hirsutum TaxID=265104 RepID=A0A9P8L5K5_9PEZI|nr:hypothetical protein GP486_006454 [Trichoglossum hirsutum]